MSTALIVVALAVAAPPPLRLPADVEDAYALRFNPAGLGRVPASELRVYAGGAVPADPSLSDVVDVGFGGYGALKLFGGGALGVGFEGERFDGVTGGRFVTGLGAGGRFFSLGVSWSHLWPIAGDNGGFWSLGAQLRPTSWMSVAFATQDVGEQQGQRFYDTGIALRPWSRVLFASRWRASSEAPVNSDTLDLVFRGEVEAYEGVHLGAAADLDGRVLFQLRLDVGERASVGGQLTAGRGGNVGGLVEGTVRRYRERSFVPRYRVAVIDLAGDLKPSPQFSLFRGGFSAPPYGAVPLFLDRLRRDEQLVGVLARIGPLEVGWATAEEVRTGLLRIRDSGRRVDCQLTGGDDKAYFVASACTTIVVPPPAQIALNGVQANLLFIGDALSSNGIRAEVYRRDEYKTAPEQYVRNGVSPAQRESLGAYLDQVQATLIQGVAEGRDLPASDVAAILRRGILTSSEAKSLRLVDEVMYPDEVEDFVRQRYPRRVKFAGGSEALTPRPRTWAAAPRIAIIHVDAVITGGRSRNLPFGLGRNAGSSTLIAALERARKDDSIRAIVLRVDSPGGGAFASDLVARAVERAAETKPLIASFGDVAASGGYYVAAGASTIFAQPTTLTGSIGVFTVRFSGEALFGRLGIRADRLGPGIGASSPFLDATPDERAIIRKSVDDVYERFVGMVARARNKPLAAVQKVAQGRVWTGHDARKHGLVDEIGGLADALERARRDAGIPDRAPIRLVQFPDDVQSLPMATQLIRAAGITPEAEVWPAELWPAGLRALVVPLLLNEPARLGAPAPLAWLPLGLSVD